MFSLKILILITTKTAGDLLKGTLALLLLVTWISTGYECQVTHTVNLGCDMYKFGLICGFAETLNANILS